MKFKNVFVFVVLVMFLFIGSLQGASIEKGPYLIYEGNNTQMTVLWQLDAVDTCTLEWGTTTSYSTGSVNTNEYGSDHQHKYAIPNLSTGTKYYYRVTFGSSSYTGSFRSGPAGSAQNVKIFAYGDTRTYPADHNDVANRMINTFTVDPAYQTLTLHVADYVDDGESESDWTNEFFPRSYSNLLEMQANLPIMGCIGNHEGNGVLLRKYYPYPYENSSDFYYSFDYGPIHVAVIDQYSSYSSGSTQYNWLVNDLSSTSKKWIFLVLHEPGWSAGGHSNEVPVQDYIQPLCTQYGVDIVFGGHNHYYARCVVDDIQHVTTGGGGAPLYSPSSSAQYLVASDETNHHCEIDIQGSQLNFVARDSNGSVIDSFVLNDTSVPQPPVAEFTADSTNVTEGGDVSFSDQSTNIPTSWSWTFEGGSPATSTAENPTVTYNTAGTYDVTLIVTNSLGNDTESKTNFITVTEYLPTVGNTTVFSSNTTSANRRAMPFTMPEDGTINSVTMYHTGGSGSMILGVYDGESSPSGRLGVTASTTVNAGTGWQTINLTSSAFVSGGSTVWLAWVYQSNPGIHYESGTPGRVDAGVAWSGGMPNPFGSSSQANYLYSIYAAYTPGGGTVEPPVANFTGSPTTVNEGQSVSFTDSSTNTPTSWSWSFPGGTPSTSTAQNPTVTYNTAGTYSVTLTATNSAGSDPETKSNYITVEVPTIIYCTSSANNQGYEWIAGVQVGSINNSTGATGYSDFTAQSANLTKGASVSITLTPGFASGSYSEYWKIWIDLNHDGDFADSGEEVYSGNSSSAISSNFTVPTSASSGNTRMRVSMQYNSAPPYCGTFTYGEVEDYTVNIQ